MLNELYLAAVASQQALYEAAHAIEVDMVMFMEELNAANETIADLREELANTNQGEDVVDEYKVMAAALLPHYDGDPVHLDAALKRFDALVAELKKRYPPNKPAPVDPAPAPDDPEPTPPSPTPTSQDLYINVDSTVAEYAGRTGDPAAQYLSRIPTAIWLGGWSGKINDEEPHAVRIARALPPIVSKAKAKNQRPMFVLYDLPLRDWSGKHSAGGVDGAVPYKDWIKAIDDACVGVEAIFIVEPDALADLPNLPADRVEERKECIRYAVSLLSKRHAVYIDASHPRWVPADTMAKHLTEYAALLADGLDATAIDKADGFIVNVSNRRPTDECRVYADQINSMLPAKQSYLIDTSRNGVAKDEWCNPTGERIGELPDYSKGIVWGKVPGESDGPCNGGPAAGVFWPEKARELTTGVI